MLKTYTFSRSSILEKKKIEKYKIHIWEKRFERK